MTERVWEGEKGGWGNSERPRMEFYLDPPFSLSLLLDRRPNLGLFGQNTAPHLREKGVKRSFMFSPYTLSQKGTAHLQLNLHKDFLCVKFEISIQRAFNIENVNTWNNLKHAD